MDAPGAGLSSQSPRAQVRAAVRSALADLDPGDRVLVALSGGPDSLALLAATVRVTESLALPCSAVVVDHALQAGSAEVAARAVAQARLLGCPDAWAVTVTVAQGPGADGPEAAARAARYAAIDAAAQGDGSRPAAAAVLLGHTRDDQAETVLLGMVRGSGVRSLAGMAARSGRYRRPLLELPRAVVRAAAEADAQDDPRLAAWSDPHNDSSRFTRVRVRTAVMPTLERALGPGVGAGLARTAGLARDDADALDQWADQVWSTLIAHGSIAVGDDVADPEPSDPGPPPGRADPGALPSRAESPGIGEGRTTTPSGRVSAQVRAASLTRLAVPGGDDARDERLSAADAPVAGGPPSALPRAIRSRVIRRLLLAAGCPAGALTAQHVQAVLALVDSAPGSRAEIALPGARKARREGPYVRVRA